jgi:hypothetical protein
MRGTLPPAPRLPVRTRILRSLRLALLRWTCMEVCGSVVERASNCVGQLQTMHESMISHAYAPCTCPWCIGPALACAAQA